MKLLDEERRGEVNGYSKVEPISLLARPSAKVLIHDAVKKAVYARLVKKKKDTIKQK